MNKKYFSVMLIFLIVLSGIFSTTSFSSNTTLKASNLIDLSVTEKLELLEQKSEENNWTFNVGITSASGRPIESLCGFEAPDNWWNDSNFNLIKSSSTLPSSFDWRDESGVTPVKDQGNCGSCWAFATIAPLESAIKIKDGVTVDLSEQWLLSCNSDGWDCSGGWWAHDYHQWKPGKCPLDPEPGAVLESEFPYMASPTPCSSVYNHVFLIENWAFIGSQQGVPINDAIKQAIYDYGPASSAVRITSDWSYYTSGVWNQNDVGNVNHGITIVGWDDNMGSDGVWIIKNSWGTDWGENGYMYIEYGCSNIGYAACYVDGYRGPPGISEEKVTLTIQEITNDPSRGDFENIEPPFNKPEWYYRVGAEMIGETQYQYNYNIDPDDWWIFEWISEYTWIAEEDHLFITTSPVVEFTIKLMDEDLWPDPDDLADVSAYSDGGQQNGAENENRGAIYHGTYNLISDTLTGDYVTQPDSNGFYTTTGDGDENAKVWFKIADTFESEQYMPDISINPSSLSFTDVTIGSNPSETIEIKNDANYHIWADSLQWTISSDKSWISFDKTSGNIPGSQSDDVIVSIDSDGMIRGKEYSGTITIDSNDETKTVDITVIIKKARSRNNYSSLFDLIEENFPFINWILKTKLFF